MHKSEIVKYSIIGGIATLVHFCALVIIIELTIIKSTGIANFLASFFGITSSYLGNKFWVFNKTPKKITLEITQFYAGYISIAIVHACFLTIWSDFFELNYIFGFIFAVAIQFIFGYLTNKLLVFKG
jgi:putative flippase GtrA